MPPDNIPVVQFKSKRPIPEQFPTSGLIMGGTVDIEAVTTIVAGVPVDADTYILGTLQEKRNGIGGLTLVQLISCQPLPDGSNSFKVELTVGMVGGQSILLGFTLFKP